MFLDIAYYPLLGVPLVKWFGILAILCFALTAAISILNRRKIRFIPFKWHPRMAYVSLIVAALHALLVLLASF